MTRAEFRRTFVLAADSHFTSLALEQRSRARRRYRHGPDLQAAVVAAVAALAPRSVLEVGGGAGMLAAVIGRYLGVRVVAVDTNAALAADAHARGVRAVVAGVRALPFERAAVECVVADRALRLPRDVDRGLPEIRRVLRLDGALVAVAQSSARDGHELAALTGFDAPAPVDALSADHGADVLGRHFRHVDQQTLDYTLEFPDGRAAARYVATMPGRGAQASRIAAVDHPIRLAHGMRLFVAQGPRPV